VRLGDAAYRVFTDKGDQNAVKVRRIMQIVQDLSPCDLRQCRILDLGCAEGVYSIEAGLRGAEVLALDSRPQRLEWGQAIANDLGLSKVRFQVADVRKLSPETLGQFHVVLFLGLLYHLDLPDAVNVLTMVSNLCSGLMIIDTHIAVQAEGTFSYRGKEFAGRKVREHADTDSEEEKLRRLAASLDNVFSFFFTKDALYQLLHDCGFTTVMECYVPLEPAKTPDRITLLAVKGAGVKISSYPWINALSEAEIEKRMIELGPWKDRWREDPKPTNTDHEIPKPKSLLNPKSLLRKAVKSSFDLFGYEIRRK
jgi:2-polyprenyl-3-methyl-5-hydroxy-6-metoxy-1,4-benzoquinol methylase